MRLVSSPLSSDVDVVRVAYDTVAEDYAAYLPDARAEAPLDLAMVDAFVQAVGTGEPVLDAGCGAGRMSRHLADRGVEVSGVDLSPGMISMARRDHPDLEFQAGEGTRDASASYRRFGHEVRLERQLHAPDQVAAALADGGLRDVARLVRGPRGGERDDQAFVLSQRG